MSAVEELLGGAKLAIALLPRAGAAMRALVDEMEGLTQTMRTLRTVIEQVAHPIFVVQQSDSDLAPLKTATTVTPQTLPEPAANVQPAPEPAPPRRKWTVEAQSLLRELTLAAVPDKEIAVQMCTLLGRAVSVQSIQDLRVVMCKRGELPRRPQGYPRAIAAPAPAQPAAAPESKPPAQSFWTPAACELIGKLTAASAKDAEIAVQVSALLDRPVSASAVKNQRTRMRNRGEVPHRPTGRPKAAAPDVPAPVAEVAQPAAVQPSPPIVAALPKPGGVRIADRAQIRGFVASKGWTIDPDDIAKVNAKCLAIGAPRFILGKRETAFDVRNWAKVARMPDGSTLEAVNAERTERGLPVFIVEGGKL